MVEILKAKDADFVIRRRIPAVLAQAGGSDADDALLDALTSNRFEIRYRSALALVSAARSAAVRAWSCSPLIK